MRTFLFLFTFLFFCGSSFCQSGWVSLNPSEFTPVTSDFYFINSKTGWAAGPGGMIIKTTSSGAKWSTQNYDAESYFLKIFFLDSMHGWAGGSMGKMVRTTNGGISWDLSVTGTTDEVKCIYFINESKGFIGTSANTSKILITTNGGVTWEFNYDPGYPFPYEIKFFDSDNGVVTCSTQKHLKTTNGGINWSEISANQFSQTFYSEYLDGNTGWVSTNTSIWKTTNSGGSWLQQLNFSGANCLTFLNSMTGFAASQSTGNILKTTNGGTNWNLLSQLSPQVVTKIKFFDSNTGYLKNGLGRMMRTTNGGINWISNETSFNENDLYTSKFFSSGTGYIGGWNTLLKTTNNGDNFTQLNIGGKTVNSLYFFNEQTGWICGNSGFIMKTTNGGMNWTTPRLYDNNVHFYTIHFSDELNGVAAGAGNSTYAAFYKTTDGGNRWTKYDITTTFPIVSTWFFNANTGIISGYGTGSTFMRTTNGGFNWSAPVTGQNVYRSICFVNNQTGWACGFYAVVKTTNGGLNWFPVIGSNYNSFRSVNFINENTGFCSGSTGLIYKTTNGGDSWINNSFINTSEYTSISIVNSNTAFICGTMGNIMRTTTGGTTFINVENISVRKDFILKQNYPNPFNPTTVISYQLPVISEVSIKVYDAIGNEVQTLVNEKQSAGSYSVEFNAASLPSGIYFYKLVTEKFSETKKMVLIK